jgi:GT2 family glycosyltransferase
MNKLSIVIVNYKSLSVIKDCLESFNKYPPKAKYETIIVNNDDNIEKFNSFAKNYQEIKFIQNTGNWGFSNGCNLGASIANGEYLLFLNPDTELNETPAIDKMLEILENDSSVGIASCVHINSEGIEENQSVIWNSWLFIRFIRFIYQIAFRKSISKRSNENCNIWYPDAISGSVVTISSSDFNSFNGWSDDKYWMYCEDQDICYKIQKILKKIALVRDCTIKHKKGASSISDVSQLLLLNTERIISGHNYIYYNNSGFTRAIIMSLYISKSLFTPIIKLSFSLLLINKKKIAKNKFIINEIIKYYSTSIKRKTWNSEKLKYKKSSNQE